MRLTAIALLAALAVSACSSSETPGSASPATGTLPQTPTSSEPPAPSPSGEGFCTDRTFIGDVYRLLRAGTVGYREAAASVVAAAKVMRVDAATAPTPVGTRKLRQFVLYLNTLRLAVLGAAENYPADFSVKQFTNGLVDRVRDILGEFDCPS